MIECAVETCTTKKYCRGLCGRHYQQWRTGRMSYTPPPLAVTPDGCRIEGCDRTHAAKGLCMSHWRREKNGADMAAPIRPRLYGATTAQRLRTYAPVGAPDECWEWTRSGRKGYGSMGINGEMRDTHVVAWELANGRPAPKGLDIRHTCDNRPCTNPAHLVLGTRADNMADKVARNRQDKGMKHGMSKLTDDQVLQIRTLHAEGEMRQRDIAELFGVKQANVSLIVRGKTWTHI